MDFLHLWPVAFVAVSAGLLWAARKNYKMARANYLEAESLLAQIRREKNRP